MEYLCFATVLFDEYSGNMFYLVDVAQLVRVPGCGPGGRRFDPDHPPHFFVHFYILGCRQVVRHRTLTPLSAGSNPAIPARIKHRICGAFSFISLLNHTDSNQPIGEADYNRCEVTLNEVQAANPAIPARKNHFFGSGFFNEINPLRDL